MKRLSVNHNTTYEYDMPVAYGLQQLRLTPKERVGQHIVDWDITIEGGKKELSFLDNHANHVDLISIEPGVEKLVVRCAGTVEIAETSGVIGTHKGCMALWTFLRPTQLTTPGTKIEELIAELGDDHESDIALAHALSALIIRHVPYTFGVTQADTGAEEAMIFGGGVCQDHAHIFITAMRQLGFPARYVSGYLMMNDREEQDATHAWAEAHLEGIGWVGFDVSNGYSPDDRYIRVATGLDYKDASPMSGMRFGNNTEHLAVQLQVQQ